jgi:hypothetical protein
MDLNRKLYRYTSRHYISIALLAKVPLQVEMDVGADRRMMVLLCRYPANVTEIGFSVTLFFMLLPQMACVLALTSNGRSAIYTNAEVSLKMYNTDHH